MQHHEKIAADLLHNDIDKFNMYKGSEYAGEIYNRVVDENTNNRTCVIQAVTSVNSCILNDDSVGHIDNDMMDDIFRKIQNTEISSLIYRRDFLEKIINIKIKPDSGVTSVPVPLILELSQIDSKITPVNIEDIEKYRHIIMSFKLMLTQYSEMDQSEKITLMIISMSIFSGVFSHKNLLAFSNMSYNDIKNRDDIYWIDLPHEITICNHGLVRKVYIDKTSLQIMRLNLCSKKPQKTDNGGWGLNYKTTKEELGKNIKSIFFKYAGINNKTIKHTTDFLNILVTYGAYWQPIYVLNYSSGINVSYSSCPSAAERFMFGKLASPTKKKIRKKRVSTIIKKKLISEISKTTSSYDEDNLVSNIKNLINSDDFSGIKRLLESEQLFSSTLRYIVEWCMALRKGTAPGRRGNNEKSVLQSFECLSVILPAFINGEDLVSLGVDIVADCYDKLLEYKAIEFMESFQSVSDKVKKSILSQAKSITKNNSAQIENESYIDGILNIQSSVSQELKTFHKFLMSVYGVDKINFHELDGFLSARHSVNANIIMPHEYDEILNVIWPSKNKRNRIERIRCIIFILGYRLGMRRMEILQLMLKDFSGNKYMTLKILSNEYGSIKSTSSKRWMPIHDLLTKDEFLILLEWIKLRKNEAAGCSEHSLVFTLEPSASKTISVFDKMLTIDSTYDVIHALMRKVTGDNDVSFHSLRHSFVSWHILLQEAKRIPSIICDKIFSLRYLKEDDFHSRVFIELLNYDDSSSKMLYQLSILVGHSTPYITLLHYSHFMDWISHNWMLQATPLYNIQEIAVLLGVEKSSVYTKLKGIKASDDGKYHINQCVHLSKKMLLKSI